MAELPKWVREGDPQFIPESLTVHKMQGGGYFAYVEYEIVESRRIGGVQEVRTRREKSEPFDLETSGTSAREAHLLQGLMDIVFQASAQVFPYVKMSPEGRLRVRPGDEPRNPDKK